MDKKNKNPNVPNLRFDFQLPWKTYKVDNIIESCGGGTPSTKVISYWQGDIPWISSSDLFENNIRDINVSRYITKEAIKCSAAKLCPKKTICIVSRVGVGKVAVTTEFLCTSQDFMNITHFEGNKYFLAQLIQNKIKSSQLQGTSIKGITSKEIKDMSLFIPSRAEQDKIVKFLNIIDQRIETQIKIIDDLVLQKKYITNSLLESIQDNEKIMLKDVLFDYNVKTTVNNEYPVLSSTASGMYLQSDYFNKETSSDNTIGYKIVPRGYCTYRSMSDTGLFTFNMQKLVEKGIVSPAYPVFSSNDDYINEFIILYLNNSSYIKKQILESKSGGTRFALPFSALCTLKIPKLEKEKQLASIKTVTAFERKIENEEIILDKLHQQKNYLLNNVFI